MRKKNQISQELQDKIILTIDLFLFFINRVQKNPRINISKSERTNIKNFFTKRLADSGYIKQNTTIEHLFLFIAERFAQNENNPNARTRYGANKIFGDDSIEIFKKTIEKDTTCFYGREFCKKNNIQLIEFTGTYEIDRSIVNEFEETEKQRCFDNDKSRFQNCVRFTSLFNHKSTWCMRCFNKKECKEMLFELYPTLFEKRGYKIEEQQLTLKK